MLEERRHSTLVPAHTAMLASGFPGLFLSNSSLINSRCVDPRYWKTWLWLGCIPVVFESNRLNLSHFTWMNTTFRKCFVLKFYCFFWTIYFKTISWCLRMCKYSCCVSAFMMCWRVYFTKTCNYLCFHNWAIDLSYLFLNTAPVFA